MANLNLDLRKDVLFYSLLIESIVSNVLALQLGNEQAEDTLCFGNTSNALSFNQKVNLLIDIAALDIADKGKFVAFMEVRNQLMHNSSANTFERCFSYLEGRDKFVLKLHPQDQFLSREDQLKEAFEALAKEVGDLASGLFDKVKEKRALEEKKTPE